ncbi:hypothetical protein [Streptomyces sp. NPDC048442]|uniref:hypothetical protein n=1 Tax=Streptomyces sp. NPDC048442 TaxID=3154823 RepID=UPI0034272EC1
MRRQGVAVGSCAVALCLGGWLAFGGDGGADKGFVAVGAAGAGPEGAPTKAVPPEGRVELVPLDPAGPNSPSAPGGSGSSAPGSGAQGSGAAGSGAAGSDATGSGAAGSDATGSGAAGSATGTSPGADPGPGGPDAARDPADSGSTPDPGRTTRPPGTTPPQSGPPPAPPSEPSQPAPPQSKPRPPAPAALTVGSPVRAGAGKRWCEKVTVSLRNSGGTAVRSGTVTFATHIIGALGIDWGTRTSSQPLPGPIGPGAARSATYTVCVDAWRVPLGMHVETRRVTAAWK